MSKVLVWFLLGVFSITPLTSGQNAQKPILVMFGLHKAYNIGQSPKEEEKLLKRLEAAEIQFHPVYSITPSILSLESNKPETLEEAKQYTRSLEPNLDLESPIYKSFRQYPNLGLKGFTIQDTLWRLQDENQLINYSAIVWVMRDTGYSVNNEDKIYPMVKDWLKSFSAYTEIPIAIINMMGGDFPEKDALEVIGSTGIIVDYRRPEELKHWAEQLPVRANTGLMPENMRFRARAEVLHFIEKHYPEDMRDLGDSRTWY